MSIRALVVDDSAFFRRWITEMLQSDPEITVVGDASNGQEAVELVAKLRPDVITMDVKMPVMDGITAVKKIMSIHPTPVLMFSAVTSEGARATLDALDAGALDFLPKRMGEMGGDRAEATRQFCGRIKALARTARLPSLPKAGLRLSTTPNLASRPAINGAAITKEHAKATAVRLVVIGASTGGPLALQRVLTELPAAFPTPILVIQHMPATFTATFAERLNQLCRVTVKEAADGDELRPGTVYVAPGGKQMLLRKSAAGAAIQIKDGEPEQTYRPCVDLTFKSVAAVYRRDVIAIVMTGMGADGREGSRVLKELGASIWAQDEASCVVYGMPMAVINAGIANRILSVDEIGACLVKDLG
jgi:two-component system chemotaxis response regulator CheB